MKASETVMKDNPYSNCGLRQETGKCNTCQPLVDAYEKGKLAQAEISFKAGIKEVIDFLYLPPYPLINYFGINAKERLQTKLKEWGIS